MWVKQFHKPSPGHHHFYRWYVAPIPSHGWPLPRIISQRLLLHFGMITQGIGHNASLARRCAAVPLPKIMKWEPLAATISKQPASTKLVLVHISSIKVT